MEQYEHFLVRLSSGNLYFDNLEDAEAQVEFQRIVSGVELVVIPLEEITLAESGTALQSQKPKANDLMLSGVIRMPFEMAMSSPISRMQFYQRAQQALNELEALQSQDREGYAGVTVWVDGAQCTKIITRIQYESSSADELLRHFEAARAAINHVRQIEGE